MNKRTKTGPGCEYCECPERYNLTPARIERAEEHSGFDKTLLFVAWHYEAVVYLRAVPRTRVRCQKNA